MLIVGGECLLIESATLGNAKMESVQVSNGWFQQAETKEVASGGKTFKPPEWMPWSLIFSGAVVLLYSFTLPRRWGQSGG